MSLRSSVLVVATEDTFNDTSVAACSLAFVQLNGSIAKHHGRNGVCAIRSLTATECIVGNRTASQVDLGTLLDTSHLAATIDILADGAAFDVHVSPNGGSKHGRIIFVCRSIISGANPCKCTWEHRRTRTSAGTEDTAANAAAIDIHLRV